MKSMWTYFYLFIFVCIADLVFAQNFVVSREATTSLPQLVKQYGYPIKKYTIQTSDGYKIDMFRMNNGTLDPKKFPILLVHGMAGSAEDYVRMGPNRSLAFLLADNGYDVWIGNFRGTAYSSHISLKKSSMKFWNFSFNEHGTFDVPTMMEKVLNTTGAEKMHYVGFSMGTTSYFVACHRRPDLAARIASFSGLAPVTSLGSFVKRIAQLAYNTNIFQILRSLQMDPLSFPSDVQYIISSILCNPKNVDDDICFTLSFPLVGEDYDQVDWNKSVTIFARLQPVTLKQIDHYGQMAMTGLFREYDWGRQGNIEKYGYPVPAIYNHSANIAPTALYYGQNDVLADPVNVVRLSRTLKPNNPKVIRKRVVYKNFNHLDFVYAKDVHKLLNYDVLETIETMLDKSDNKID